MDDTPEKPNFAADVSNPFTAVPIEITVSVGKARPLVRDLVMLGANAVLTLDKRVDDPVELFVGEKLIARGMLEESEDENSSQLLVRLTEVINLHSGL